MTRERSKVNFSPKDYEQIVSFVQYIVYWLSLCTYHTHTHSLSLGLLPLRCLDSILNIRWTRSDICGLTFMAIRATLVYHHSLPACLYSTLMCAITRCRPACAQHSCVPSLTAGLLVLNTRVPSLTAGLLVLNTHVCHHSLPACLCLVCMLLYNREMHTRCLQPAIH